MHRRLPAEHRPQELRGVDHCRRTINADDVGSGRRELHRQSTITAAKIENPLAGLRGQQVENATGKVGNKSALLRILGSVPRLPCCIPPCRCHIHLQVIP
jgi:hypothetical protein